MQETKPVAATISPSTGDAAAATALAEAKARAAAAKSRPTAAKPVEVGGPAGPEPTRYGDWERNGRVSDF